MPAPTAPAPESVRSPGPGPASEPRPRPGPTGLAAAIAQHRNGPSRTPPGAADPARRTLGGDDTEGYAPIRDYAIIGDARSAALVTRDGSIDWWCIPRYDGDPVLARLLDASRGGTFRIRPVARYRATRRYLEGTPMLETTFETANAVVRVLDFMPALTEAQKRTHPVPFREIIRRIRVEGGSATIRIELAARPGFGRVTPRTKQLGPLVYAIEWGDQALHLVSSHPLVPDGGTVSAELRLDAGRRLDLALSYSPEAPADLPILAHLDTIQGMTTAFWTVWTGRCTYTGPYAGAVLRSILTLKLLTYAPSGAIIAAPTTSLPERIRGVRNWDYRYCWLRDAAFTIRALLSLGYIDEAHAFAEWMLHATRLTHPELRSLYTGYGSIPPPERVVPYLDGYRASRPVRVGNRASRQFQLDIYGEVVDALALYHRSGGIFFRDSRNLIRGIARNVVRRWREPDEGIWEVRSGPAQHVHSKVMAWVGLQRLVELDGRARLGLAAEELRRAGDEIHRWVVDRGYDRDIGAFVRSPGTRDLDAALLVIPLVGFLDAGDPRVVGTVDAVRRELARGDLVYRYLGPDGLPGGEGAFVLCSFWLVEALARIGRIDEAHAHFERLLARANDVGLYAEQIDPETGEHLGNFPQAFSHIGLINAALTLEGTAAYSR